MSNPRTLLTATDTLSIAADFVEAIFMAAHALNTSEATAIQQVCEAAKGRIKEACEIIEEVKRGGLK